MSNKPKIHVKSTEKEQKIFHLIYSYFLTLTFDKFDPLPFYYNLHLKQKELQKKPVFKKKNKLERVNILAIYHLSL